MPTMEMEKTQQVEGEAEGVEVKSKGKPRGFAAMDPEKVRQIAAMGGRAAQALGTAHQFTSEEAQAAGRKGGAMSRRPRGTGKTEQG